MAPFVSVLLPTRNRLEYLRYAAQTVLRQDDPDLELVISDNDSSEDIEGFVRELDDDRVVYHRTESFVPVTENWNNALERSTGDYVVMLGDDDGLMPGYVRRMREVVERFSRPEVVYQSAWIYAYPGVFPDQPAGFLQPYGYADFFDGADDAFRLDTPSRRRVVADALRFRISYGFNMQFSTVSRTLIERLAPQGPFFQSAFPDYYATNVAFLTASEVVVDPTALVAIGVTPKSYGFFHANSDETGGKAFLEGGPRDRAPTKTVDSMPGTYINTGWISAVQAIATRYPQLIPVAPAIRRFRFLQADFVYEGHFLRGDIDAQQLGEMESYLTPRERRIGRAAVRTAALVKRVLPARASRGAWAFIHYFGVDQFTDWDPPKMTGTWTSLLDVFERPPATPPREPVPLRRRLRNALRSSK